MAQRYGKKNKYHIKVTGFSGNSKSAMCYCVNKKLNKFLEKVNFPANGRLYISIDMSIEKILTENFKSLRQIRETFKTDEDCKAFLEELIWEGEPVSPYDKSSQVYKCKDGWYKCKNTGKEFNILTKTLFQNTKIDLPTWFEIIFREHSDKGGLAATTIMRDYGLSYTTAWHMLHKIRNAMGFENHKELSGTVEVDEYYAGGSLKNMHYDKKLEVKEKTYQNKKLLQGFVERNGDLVIRTVSDMTESTLNAGVLRYVKTGSTLYSDDNQSYQKLPPLYNRGIVVHSKGRYVDKDNKSLYTNTIECCWSGFERIESTHIKISNKHLQNYANEPVFRYNTRKMKSADACIWFLQNILGTNLTWKDIQNAKYRQYNRNQARVA